MKIFDIREAHGKVVWIIIAAIILVVVDIAFGGVHTICCTEEEAYQIAATNEVCADKLTNAIIYNSETRTWWIDIDVDREGCNPACVVDEKTRKAGVNWRCTGLIR